MDRRLFMLLAAAGLTDPGPPPSPPPDSADAGPLVLSGDVQFDAWMQSFFQRSVTAGWPVALLQTQLAGLSPDPRVTEADTKQPELSKPIGDYMRAAVSDRTVMAGRDKRAAAAWLGPIEDRFGVPGQILTAVWGEETYYGAIQGDMDVIRSLATLAADGRRRDWAESQIWDALRMIQSGEVSREQMRGSWAGAMGQTQLIPEAYLADAVDGDGDGRRDIWGSPADALASAANMLAKYGWRRGEGWAREVLAPPDFDFSLAEGPQQPPAAWAALGLRTADGDDWSEPDRDENAQFIAPAGAAGPLFLVLPNHFVIRRYNNSTTYALAVGLLADRIAGAPPLVTPWPVEQPLASADRIGAQQALTALGFNPGAADGVIGTATRAAIRTWQKARGLPADGYLTVDLAHRLQNEAAAQPGPATAPAPR